MKNTIFKHLSKITGLIRKVLTFFIALMIAGLIVMPGKKSTIITLMQSDKNTWIQNGQFPPFSLAIFYILSSIITLIILRLCLIYIENLFQNFSNSKYITKENNKNLKNISQIILIGLIIQIILNLIFYIQSPKHERFFFLANAQDYSYYIIFLALFLTGFEYTKLKLTGGKNASHRNRR